jgi:hypothetical protein
VSANPVTQERATLDAAIDSLRARLPTSWTVERPLSLDVAVPAIDGVVQLKAPNGTYTTIAVEVKQTVIPRDVASMTSGLVKSLRGIAGHVPLLVVAPWLSERTRAALTAQNINYLDLTGNVLLQLDNPVVYLRSDGATRNPTPPARARARLKGAKAARLVRLLADVRPPYGVGELAHAAGLTAGYVSRLLDALDREAIIDRGARGVVTRVDLAGLLREWAQNYDVLRPDVVTTWLAPDGAAAIVPRLGDVDGRAAVTGSFAAVRWAPVAAPTQLMAYCADVRRTADQLRLLPADEGANVLLLRPFDDVVWSGSTTDEDGATYAAPSQVVADCLTGTGRMPAEGEALLAWMLDDESRWRAPAIPTPEWS